MADPAVVRNADVASAVVMPAAGSSPEESLVEEELLVEEVSIDGMCGVY